MLFTTLYNMVDVYFAGQISTDAQAGLAIGFQAFFVLIAFAFGTGAAMSALVGNARGKKDDAEARRLAIQGVSFAVMATLLLITVGAMLGPHLINLVSEPGDYREAATGYYRFLLAAMPGFVIAFSAILFAYRKRASR